MAQALSQQNLPQLAAVIDCPQYDRTAVKASIVHVGVGGFHRSHEAYYTDALMRAGGALDWGICGVGLREADRRMADVLKAQDHLYALVVRHPDGRVESRVIGSIVDFLLGPDDPAAVVARMAHPDTRIVSLTITEGGYNFDPTTGEFDFSNPDVQHELAHPDQPRTVFGYLAAALQARRAAVLGCEGKWAIHPASRSRSLPRISPGARCSPSSVATIPAWRRGWPSGAASPTPWSTASPQ